MSSLLKPDPRQLQQFIPFSDYGRATGEIPVQTYRLDNIEEVQSMDFLKIDVQGFELTIFQNGRNKLREAVALHVELPFVKALRESTSVRRDRHRAPVTDLSLTL
jgi:FkbM family methyltransferase